MNFIMNKTLNVTFNINGPIVKDNGIDLYKIVPALLSLGEIIKESNNSLNYYNQVGINIKPFKKGSFNFIIAFFDPIIYQSTTTLIPNAIDQIKEVLIWIGLIGAIPEGTVSLIKLIKFLKGKLKRKEVISPNTVNYVNGDDQSLTVNGNVDKLFMNPIIKKNFYIFADKFSGEEGITALETYLSSDLETKEIITHEDIEHIKEYAETDFLEDLHVVETEVYLKFGRGSFEGRGDNWSFKLGDRTIIATIRDENFKEQVRTAKIRPSHLDTFKVVLRLRQDKTSGRTTYEIIKALEYKQAPTHPELF
jgi:hypothetical protein